MDIGYIDKFIVLDLPNGDRIAVARNDIWQITETQEGTFVELAYRDNPIKVVQKMEEVLRKLEYAIYS